uniref:Uncharacterized protein n=1 Tax=Rhizophora mucronata TaxID=61149 RepID=A0A2P2N749_RHIMU
MNQNIEVAPCCHQIDRFTINEIEAILLDWEKLKQLITFVLKLCYKHIYSDANEIKRKGRQSW